MDKIYHGRQELTPEIWTTQRMPQNVFMIEEKVVNILNEIVFI